MRYPRANHARPVAMLLAAALLWSTTGTLRAQSGDSLPPSWRHGAPTGKAPGNSKRTDERYDPAPRANDRPWYKPRFAFGMGLNVPELVPFEGYAFFGRHFALRAFYTPPLPFNIRIEMPADVISTSKGVGVANPDFTIRLKATYGAHYGLEALTFPFAGSFFLAAGVAHRRMRLVGDAKSPILVCSLVEAAKDPPCGDPNARIETRTEIELKADVETTALLGRAGLGWYWHVGDFGYFMANAGATKPLSVKRRAAVEANLDTPSGTDEEVSGALAQIKAEKEADLEDKAIGEMRPVDEKTLPIFGIAAGVRF